MKRTVITENRFVWLVVGLILGMGVSWFWPHEPAMAVTTDRSSRFALATSEVSILGASTEALFVLDFLTGDLKGAVLNSRVGKFSSFYYRKISGDFNVQAEKDKTPQYAIVSGRANLPSARGVSPAAGVLYIAELTSGKVMCYSYPYSNNNRAAGPIPLVPIDGFSFREAVQGN